MCVYIYALHYVFQVCVDLGGKNTFLLLCKLRNQNKNNFDQLQAQIRKHSTFISNNLLKYTLFIKIIIRVGE